jgi:hypothetical protein
MSWIRTISDRHERIKEYIHNGFRYPLPKYGQYFMGFVYFSIPVISGWYIMQWAISKSHQSIGYYGENLPTKSVQGVGDQRPVVRTISAGKTSSATEKGSDLIKETEQIVEYQKVGAGGWGGGVHLVVSDEEEQKKNRKKFRTFLKKLQLEDAGSDDIDKTPKAQ